MEPAVSIILGGGQGKRLFPLTKERAKPAVPIGGKYRLVDIPISNSLNSGIKKIFVLTQFNSVSLHRHIVQTYRFGYFSDVSLDLLAAQQTLETADWFQGTADAVRKNLSHFRLDSCEAALILSGDQLYQMKLQELLSFLKEKRADFVVAVHPVGKGEIGHLGMVKINREGRITGFTEKPREVSANESVKGKFLASMGIYAFRPKILKRVLKGRESDFGKEVIPNAIGSFRAFAFVFRGYWRDIGTIKNFYEASLELTHEKPAFNFFSGDERIYTRPRFLPPLRMDNARIKRCILSEGCVVEGASLAHSVIGLRSVIRKGTVIRDTILMGADYYEARSKGKPALGIGENCRIEKAIIDKNVRIGPGVRITNPRARETFDGKNYFIRDGIVVIPKNAVIRSGMRI